MTDPKFREMLERLYKGAEEPISSPHYVNLLQFPRHRPQPSFFAPQPDAFARISVELRGGQLPPDETVLITYHQVRLTVPFPLHMGIRDKAEESIRWGNIDLKPQDLRLSIMLDQAKLLPNADGEAYTIELNS